MLAPPGQRSRLLISTFPDWAAFGEWYARTSKLTDEVTPAIAAKAAELTREGKGDREKVLALYNYVTNLRYVAVPLGVNGWVLALVVGCLSGEWLLRKKWQLA